MIQIPTFEGFPEYRVHCKECNEHAELVATMPKDGKTFYKVACFSCLTVYKESENFTEAIQHYRDGILSE